MPRRPYGGWGVDDALVPYLPEGVCEGGMEGPRKGLPTPMQGVIGVLIGGKTGVHTRKIGGLGGIITRKWGVGSTLFEIGLMVFFYRGQFFAIENFVLNL